VGQSYINHNELKDFVESHSLQNRFSIVQFSAYVTIYTAKNTLKDKMNVSITFGGFENAGTVSLLGSRVDAHHFPTIFEAKWESTIIKHLGGAILNIKGFHSKNLMIGEYSVEITPIERLRD
jgi:hypothetical protein